MSLTEVARQLGITQGALSTLNLPEPDAIVGRSRGWLPETIDAWQATRPGHGGRPRKSDDK
ncbi:hypothetical protein B9G54_01475 [Alloscardovia macacae]|uniref:Uncharacterized protein n=1 Tax=Alloscardovia macacae TaxID=1160091 RepID=A0A1Y2SYT2_9BIFI|nr:hypothetical protein [Alloscardovia macacae]OTA27327.1 hypothetical protein B9G54_01475 [Alloscardovia macacae]OTA29227.1 hypothetical protein B9T39_03670 [Alloscardovia macacae]